MLAGLERAGGPYQRRVGDECVEFRQTTPLTPDEALRRILAVLFATFVESSEITNAAIDELSRLTPSDPPASSVVAAWECKFYRDTLDKALGRSFVGLMDDLGTNYRLSGLCSNVDSAQLRMYFRLQRRPYAIFRLTPRNAPAEARFIGNAAAMLEKLSG